MKFKCVNNEAMESQLTVGKIYEGKYSTQYFDVISQPNIEISACDDGVNGVYNHWRFKEVKEESNE